VRRLVLVFAASAATLITGCGGSTVAVIEDPEGYSCKADEARYGRCPENTYFGKSRKEVAQEKALAASPIVTDTDDFQCKTLETKYGLCPDNPNFGLTKAQVRKKEAREAAARREAQRRAREAEARRNAWKKGYTEYSDGIAYKWDNSVCDSSYFGCWGMRVVTRDGCDSLYVELQVQDSAGNAVDYTNATASHLTPGQVALLDFTDTSDSGDTARIAEINCY
jgi:hypothetical protein